MAEFFNKEIFTLGTFQFKIISLFVIIITFAFVKVILWLFSRGFQRYSKRKKIDNGRQNALLQIVKYILYFTAFLIVLKANNVDLSGILVSSGALLVGVGLGLQQTFNDFFSGIILLFEGSVNVGDKLTIEDIICKVDKIGLRTTQVTTIDNTNIIIPNSFLVTNKVTNWSHNKQAVRFYVDIGVSYSSDIVLVEQILLESLDGKDCILKHPAPSVQLNNYGDSSIDFRLFFYTYELFFINRTKSDIRKKIFENFHKNNIEIPFPQRDLWIKNPEVLKK